MGQLGMFRDLVAVFESSGVGGRHYRGVWSPTLSLGACGCCTVLVMRCCFGAVDLTCQAGLWKDLSLGRLPQFCSLVLHCQWQQQLSAAAQTVCYGLLTSNARVVPGEQRCLVAGQGSGAVVLEFLGGHDWGGGGA